MENLQNEVSALLEKCAKYKVGQTVYKVSAYSLYEVFFRKVEITRVHLDYHRSSDEHEIWYESKGPDDTIEHNKESDLFATLQELRDTMYMKHLKLADMWKHPTDETYTKPIGYCDS